MTKQERRGLELAKDLIRRMVYGTSTIAVATAADLLAAVKWIARQQGIDEKRRGPRGEYRRSR